MFSYEGIVFKRHGEPATPAQLAAFEAEIGRPLPEDYRRFLSAVNGGVLDGDLGFPMEEPIPNWDLIPLAVMFSVKPDDYDYILDHRTDYDFHRRVPEFVIPIGLNSPEDRICISLQEQDYGRVFVWSPSELWEDESTYSRGSDNLYRAAGSFDQFWKSLRAIPPSE